MGKTMYMICIIILVDILFITFWGGNSGSLQSIVAQWVSDPTNFEGNPVTIVIKNLFVTITIAAAAAAVVFRGGAKTDTVLFASFASATLYNIGRDYIAMYQIIVKINSALALILIGPFFIMFAFMIVEWLMRKD